MPSLAAGCKASPMTDPLIALAVVIGLGAYLLYTLLHPEKF